jgi:putative peptide zinc metalloprotease protein
VLSILYFLNQVFEPYGLKIIGQLIALGACYGLVVQPLVKVYKFFKVPGRLGKVKRWRMYTTLFLLIAAVTAVLFIPLPSHVYCSLVVQARGAESVYVEVPGELEQVFVEPGQRVEQGAPLAKLSDVDVDLKISQLDGQRELYEAQLKSLHNMSFDEPEAAARIEEVSESLKTIEDQIVHWERDRAKLTLIASRAGTVLPPTLEPNRSQSEDQLSTWFGSPLDPENLGATLMLGTKFCQIGDPNHLEARLVIDQGDVELVAPGNPVAIMLEQSAGIVHHSEIESVASEDLKMSPVHLSSLHGGALPTKMDEGGVARPLSPVFEAVVPLVPSPGEEARGHMRIGLVGQARITTAPRTLGNRLWRYIQRTFNFDL